MNPEIFREYDIRGIAGQDLSDEVVETLGQAIGTYMIRRGAERLTLGRDCRLSSEGLRDRLSEGLRMVGIRVVDIGVVPTPLLYFSLHHLQPEGGIMITGSHNPPEYNGFKVAFGKATIYGAEIQRIREIMESRDFAKGAGSLETADVSQAYRAHLLGAFPKLRSDLKVVLDCGNGTGSDVAPSLYRSLGCQVVPLYCEMDGRFPNHHPDPTVVEYLQDLIARVKSEKADLGIAFDGDADRIGVVGDHGQIIWGDHLMILYGRDVLRQNPGATIIADVKCSKNLYDDIAAHGGRALMWRTGHSLIKAKMKEEKAVLAGEMSGHMFFADRYFGYDDAIYAGARLLEILSRERQSVSQMLADVPKMYSTPEIRVECADREKFNIVEKLKRYFTEHYDTATVDGVRVLFEDGWGLIRASNTQPVLVLRFEARSPERLGEIRDVIEGKLREAQVGAR